MAKTSKEASSGAVHLILQGKGGVGKSVVASWFAEYLINRGRNARCIDADPVNRSLAQYRRLSAESLDIVGPDGVIVREQYDQLLQRFVREDAVFVVDSGATAFLPFWGYILETEMARVLQEAGRRIFVHCVVSGGEMLADTLVGLDTLAKGAPEQSLVVWLNEYFGEVEADGKSFSEMNVVREHASKMIGTIGIARRSADTFGVTIQRMRRAKLTFEEAIQSDRFLLAQKSRLFIVRRDLFEQIERLNLL